jgi:hypothetical protein
MFSASSSSHKLPGYQGMVLLVSIVLVCDTPIQGQENEKTDMLSPKVSLRWKFLPDQLFLGKIASGIRTLDNYPQHTTDVQDFQWSVQSVDENGTDPRGDFEGNLRIECRMQDSSKKGSTARNAF